MPTIVEEFYKKWERVESKLTDMCFSPTPSSLKILAKKDLEQLYQMKKQLDEPDPKPTTKIRGIQTEIFGIVTFEQIEKFANDYHKFSNINYMKQLVGD